MKKKLLFVILTSLLSLHVFATHQRAGEITFKYISALTYEITIVTYSYAPSPADRFELEIKWGDGTSAILQRNNGPINQAGLHTGEIVGTDIKKNYYTGIHTFPGASTYKITLEDPNRNYGIQNIPNSVEVPLFIETQLTISPFVGTNNSPQLLLPPIDLGCVDHPYIHNPGAYDPDGDSLSFKLVACRTTGGQNIAGFVMPNEIGSNVGGTFTMNPITGEISWNNPKMQGEYNIAFLIEEWRKGVKIGYITRDMQITIVTCNNHAPIIKPVADTCVEAGKTLQIKITATDADKDAIKLTATGAPFMVANPAVFTAPFDSVGRNTGLFKWDTRCNHIRKAPYPVYFKAIDNSQPVNLFDLKNINITVIGPAPKHLSASSLGNAIQLTWNKNICADGSGYRIYRRNGPYGFIPGHCETGVPAYTGYKLIATVSKSGDTTYLDNNLARGIDYCYLVTGIFADGAETYAGNEACAQLKKDAPVITHVTVEKTGATNGSIRVIWSKPTEIDATKAPGPYRYILYQVANLNGAGLSKIDSLNSLNDTVYLVNGLNTLNNTYSYMVEVYNITTGNRFLIGPSAVASSEFIKLAPGDKKIRVNFTQNVPWTIEKYVVYRQNPATLVFDSIGATQQAYYIDNNLENGKNYCYKVKAIGTYGTTGITSPLINFSQETCAPPIDNEPPCAPVISVETDCNNAQNRLSWDYPTSLACGHDAVKYLVYFKPFGGNAWTVIDSTAAKNYDHKNLTNYAGCYSVKSKDAAGNISLMSDSLCVKSDACGRYHLPNVFTPNGDERNDLLIPFPYSGVEKIDLKIFNRWGRIVFATVDPQIKWDGKIQNTDQPATDGVYYYVCDVYEVSTTGTTKRTIKGSITILR